MCANCLDDFDFLPYQYSVLNKELPVRYDKNNLVISSTTVEVREEFCCFMCMKFWFEDEEKERGWVEKR